MKPLYQRRHYTQFARSIAERRQTTYDLFGLSELDAETARLVAVFELDNPRFSRARFLAACAPGSSTPSKRRKGRSVCIS